MDQQERFKEQASSAIARNLGHRVGYEENIGIHDIRREALVKADGKFLARNTLGEAR